MKIRSLFALCFFFSSLLAVGAAARASNGASDSVPEPILRGRMLSFSCASCHGSDGKSAGAVPSFYGKSPEYLEISLKDFRSGKRYSTVMGRHAKGYTDEEIRLIAEYFGSVWKNNK